MAVFCNKCGKDLLEQSRFCPFCGVVSRRTVDGSIAFQEPGEGYFCPSCSKRTMTGSEFCMWCGVGVHERPADEQTLTCPQCKEKNPADSVFCGKCGFDLGKWFGKPAGEKRVLAGRYRIEEELGRGGMGVVYKAYDTNLDLDVAIKMVPRELAKNKQAVGILKKEAQLAIKLTHENINRLHTFERTPDEAFMVMEYVPGQTVADLLAEQGTLDEKTTVGIIIHVLEGLSHAHSKNVVHRDLKPANIMVPPDAAAKILDFGIAHVFKETMTRFSRQSSFSSGTILYMSPEQINGEPPRPHTDIYAIGVTMYEMLCGQPPFCTGAIEHQILTKAPRPLDGVSGWLNEILLRCLAKDPKDRHGTARELSEALRAGASRDAAQALPEAPAALPKEAPAARELTPGPAGRPKKWLLWAAVAVVVVIAGIALGWYLGFQRPRAKDEDECDKARKADSKEGWQAYLGERPEGACKEEAKKRLEQMAAAEHERLARIEAGRKAAEEEKARREILAKSKDVKQPGKNLYWLRCPIGQRWTGSSCKGKARKMNWHKAKKACPGGYRLPTRQEFVSLLGGCDAKVRDGKNGDCNKCANSRKCRSMFGKDKRYYWSSSSYAADSSRAWYVYFYNGYVYNSDKDFDCNVRCVRSGP